MKFRFVLLGVVLTCGCAVHKGGVSRFDKFEGANINQMAGNNVSGRVFEKTILSLNARRETRTVRPLTTSSVGAITNTFLTSVTNQTISLFTNQSRTLSTNQLPPPPVLIVATNVTEGAEANDVAAAVQAPTNAAPTLDRKEGTTNEPSGTASSSVETNQFVSITNTPPAYVLTNQTVTSSSNVGVTKGNNQIGSSANYQTMLNSQIVVMTNNVSYTTAENQVITAETNETITTLTNVVVRAVTNEVVAPGSVVHDYYLYTELTPSPEFTLQQTGESLVLLIDGVRYGFSATNSQAGFVGRKGYVSTLYKVPPHVFSSIASAKEVRIRLKGINSVIERKMSGASKNNFRKYLAKYPVELAN